MKENKYKAQRAYDARNNLIAKSYRLNAEIVKEFSTACKEAGVSQSAQLTKMMEDFINNRKLGT